LQAWSYATWNKYTQNNFYNCAHCCYLWRNDTQIAIS
jgi:hypothetical protein